MDTRRTTSPRCINVLSLDGGGVRGISTLLILRVLMQQVNTSIRKKRGSEIEHKDVEPHDIFDLVAGTSTGGLIAIMLGKLGMTVEECINAYRGLSATIFGSKHIRARFSGGLAPARYSGSRMERCVRELIHKHRFNEDLPMAAEDDDKIACALICREHRETSRYSDFKSEAVCICSLPCPEALDCLVCQAARATSAAPTYFPVQKIKGRYFADGGMEFNNPSHKIFDHYSKLNLVAESRRTSVATEAAVLTTLHGNLDFSDVRFINLGTGTEPNLEELRSKSKRLNLAFLVPGAVRMILFLKKNLTKMATNAERVADVMKTIAHVSSTGNIKIKYERFSANNGVSFIKMDRYKKLAKIEELTMEYLEDAKIQRELGRLADEIATEYIERHYSAAVPVANERLRVPTPSQHRPHTPVSQPLGTSQQSPSISSSSRESTEHSESSADNTPSRYPSTEVTTTAPSSVEASPSGPSRQILDVVECVEGTVASRVPVMAAG